ncbi:hypothetical protein SAMN04487897_1445 [Paenibacillus sp. yr247]|uniref:hypothetical protein n=1 Tax=Paenibacillus sp. yr247 TaxID=1761880 RepID=UPI0008865939|nr:hypothetical protein [Paenibacillus sp. yr247]SDP18561.1 hypothetical protein SAMN04487897_1445 [Paenibacillus sp. yr247]
MNQNGNQKSIDVTNELNQIISSSTATDVLYTMIKLKIYLLFIYNYILTWQKTLLIELSFFR